jgi:hypothetical protein
MDWILERDAKPGRWELVDLRAESRSGEVLRLEGFWTGAAWRIIGNKHAIRTLRVTMWTHKPESDSSDE